VLAFALARRWPKVLSNEVDPGWVRTRMGGAGARVEINKGQRTQSWLAVSTELAAMALRLLAPYEAGAARKRSNGNCAFQDRLIGHLSELTRVVLQWAGAGRSRPQAPKPSSMGHKAKPPYDVRSADWFK
jgi:NAD(P)-dependent dehydrogenase (short-subunit alcohol dehydrogenase family)